MLYRLAVLLAAPLVAAQSCGTTGAGTDACACYMAPCSDITSVGTTVTKTTTLGPVTGKLSGGMIMFYGIPIAASTAGANRFMPPQAATTWTTAVNAYTEKMCPTAGYPVMGTENCLTIDIFAADGVTGQAVMYFVHGGGFTGINPYFNLFPVVANQPKYNFNGLTNNGKTMMALIHYRLGALGWMAHPGFRGSSLTANGGITGTNPGSGNWGMYDTINGLNWMQSNAAAFGGDPTKVTVVGESAGGAHVAMLAASPLTVGLAHAFIAESPYITFAEATFSMTAREEMDTLFTYRTGCQSAIAVAAAGSSVATSEAACLRAASISLLIADVGFAQSSSSAAITAFNGVYGTTGGGASLFTYNSIHVWPVVDGWALTKPPLESMAAGNNAAATIVSGHNQDEYWTCCGIPSWVCAPMPDIANEGWPLGMAYLPITATWPETAAAVAAAFGGSKIQQIQSGLYYSDIVDPTGGAGQMKSIQMGTDAWFATNVPAFLKAALAAPGRSANTVYTYLYAQDTDGKVGFPLTGACHGCELSFVLGFYSGGYTYLTSLMPPSMGLTFTATSGDLAVGNAMNGYWASIFYTGGPNSVGTGLPLWTALSQSTHDTVVFSGDLALGAAMNPCSRATICRTEPTKDFRVAVKQFWGSAPADIVSTYIPAQVCTAAPTVFTSHIYGASIGINCSFLPCCTYSSGRRNLLFGMPSSASTNCDPMC